MELIYGVLLLIFCLIYFLPYLIVLGRGQRRAPYVFLANLFLGWTFMGWLFLLFIAIFDN